MKNKILLSLKYQKNNHDTYLKTMQMAETTQSDVVLFTCIPHDASEEEVDRVYLYFLKLYGVYQTIIGGWKRPKFSIEKVIQRGNFDEKLAAYLKANKSICLIK